MQALEQAAEAYYTDLPYHNWQHVQAVREAARYLIKRCRTYNMPVDEQAIKYAALFHDANYHKDPETAGYPSREAHSAAIAQEDLAEHGVDAGLINTVQDVILATHPEAVPETVEEKLLRAADLRGMMADYETFKENTLALRKEHRILYGEPLSEADWVEQVVNTLEHYLAQDIKITPDHDTDRGLSEFHAHARQNLARFKEEYSASEPEGDSN